MIIEKVREYFLNCPLLNEIARLNVDFLGVEPTEYTIDSQPTTGIIKRYVDGGVLKQYVFVFGSREYYGADVLQNLENSEFYEEFSDWLDEQTEKDNLPLLEGNKKAIGLEALTTGYLFDVSEDNARYQIQCRLIYYEN
ncbi:chloramphenicol resistance protein [Irregularibacter muris]|uniref:Chloramphenicol resistance protein n=1 Tax=Irregularibacter muris TaxID=1796619 RepID=A0AAE3L383_9FIRM|nr:chloramphenicol resistance protein [Irregularibacter muris]MCR1897813.1 chloramphenicol resistance protein [Irregularibacter muris]